MFKMQHVARSFVMAVVLTLALGGMAAMAEPVELDFLFRGGVLQTELVEHWIAEFEAANPNIKINWRIAPGGWMDQMPVWIASGTAPDVFEMWGTQPREWGENGFLLNLTPYIERDFTEDDYNDFFPVSWQAGSIEYGERAGTQFGIPGYGNIYTIYHNKTMFAEAGLPYIDDLDNQGEWTWDMLIELGRKLTRRDGDRITHYALDDNSIQHPTARGAGWIAAAGGKVFDFPENPTRFMLDEPEGIAGLQFMQDLIWEYEIVPPQNVLGQYNFNNGFAAMKIEGTGYLARMELHVEDLFEWDLGPRPQGPAGPGYYLASDMFGISATTPHAEEAWQFLNYLTGVEGATAHMEIMGRGPARRSVYPAYAEVYPDRSSIYHLIGMMEATLSPETLVPRSAEMRRHIRDEAVRKYIMTNEKPADVAIREIASAVRAIYE